MTTPIDDQYIDDRLIANAMPSRWTLRIEIESGWAGVFLIEPDGCRTEVTDGESVNERIENAIRQANGEVLQ